MDSRRFIRRNLLRWYDKNHRLLPWRKTRDPYCIWVSEVMLQQTQVRTVIPYYRNFLKHFPTIHHLARSHRRAVLKQWEGLGYYARARNLHMAAQSVVDRFQGTVPDQWDVFRLLPGVGDYIASAVLSIAFGRPHAVVDGNVKRVLSRLFAIDAPVNRPQSTRVFRDRADQLLDRRQPGKFNQAVMELGALTCRARAPECGACPLNPVCRAHREQLVSSYPARIRPRPVPRFRVATGVVFKRDRVLITQRKAQGLLGGMWEFPGGKVQAGENPDEACLRELKEETNLTVRISRHLSRVSHRYTHFGIVMDVFLCEYLSGRVRLNGPVAHRWIPWKRIRDYPFPKANLKFFPLLEEIAADRQAAPGAAASGGH